MKTVLYVGNMVLPNGNAASQRTLGNAKVLRELGYQVTFIGCGNNVNTDIIQTLQVYEGFEMFFFENPKTIKQWFNYICSLKFFLPVIEKVKPDIIILYNHPAFSTYLYLRYCKSKSIQLYADCTEWYDPVGYSFWATFKRIDTFFRMRVLNRKLDGIIAISSYLEQFYANRGVKTICIPPLIDKADPKWPVLSPKKNLATDKIQLIYVGRPGNGTKDKISEIINVLRDIKKEGYDNFRLRIIGINQEEYKSIFKDSCENLDCVSFLGKMNHLEVLSYISDSDFSIFLRDNNLICTAGFPTKFSESIACGTPVLTNLTSDLSYYLKNGENGFSLDYGSQESLKNSLKVIFKLTRDEIYKMKKICALDTTFDYHSFIREFKKIF